MKKILRWIVFRKSGNGWWILISLWQILTIATLFSQQDITFNTKFKDDFACFYVKCSGRLLDTRELRLQSSGNILMNPTLRETHQENDLLKSAQSHQGTAASKSLLYNHTPRGIISKDDVGRSRTSRLKELLFLRTHPDARRNKSDTGKIATSNEQHQSRYPKNRCAINFFGLPRAFESLVLPSIAKNIIAVNPGCDYYVHYYQIKKEIEGRSGVGGKIDPIAVLLLRDAVHKEAMNSKEYPLPIVEFVHDDDDQFWKKYRNLIQRIRTTKIDDKYLYFPWKETTYKYPETTDNIVKMWHSIQSSYELMERVAASKNIEYDIVAMFRLDVVYVTPIHIHDAVTIPSSNHNALVPPATITNFGNFPVSDRMIYGPREAVKAWATQRFARLDSHVDFMWKYYPGWGMHPERFVFHALLPLIQNITTIRQHPTICFFRARADESVWVSDCSNKHPSIAAPSIIEDLLKGNRTLHDVVQEAIGRPCAVVEPIQFSSYVLTLPCLKPSGTLPMTKGKVAKWSLVS